MRKLYAVTMGKGYKGSKDLTIKLPRRAARRFCGLLPEDHPEFAYAEFEGTEDEAHRLAADTGLTVKPIAKSQIDDPLSKPAPPVTDAEVAETKSKSKGK